MTYDALDRLTQVTYPDATTETWTYSRLDLTQQKDRLGRITRHVYDGYGRRTATIDPAGRTVSVVWCACGRVDALVDAKGQRTRWEYDAANRVTREVRADHTTDTLYAYDGTGRLATVTDPMDQVTTYTYKAAGTLGAGQLASVDGPLTNDTITYTYAHTAHIRRARKAARGEGLDHASRCSGRRLLASDIAIETSIRK